MSPYRTAPVRPHRVLSWWRRFVLGWKARRWHARMVKRAAVRRFWARFREWSRDNAAKFRTWNEIQRGMRRFREQVDRSFVGDRRLDYRPGFVSDVKKDVDHW